MPPRSLLLTSAARKASTSLWKVSKRRLSACLRGQTAKLSPGQAGTQHRGPILLCPPYLLMVCLMGLSCRWM